MYTGIQLWSSIKPTGNGIHISLIWFLTETTREDCWLSLRRWNCITFLVKKTNLLMLCLPCLRWLRCYAGTTYPELTYLGQRRMKKAFGQKVRPRGYQVGELVLKRFLPPNTDHRGKWTPNYEGPYVVKRIFYGGALMLTTMDGEGFPSPINSDAVKKKYFA